MPNNPIWLRRWVDAYPPIHHVSPGMELSRLGKAGRVRSLQVFVNTHKPSLLFVSELHTASNQRIQKNCSSLRFCNLEFVPAIVRAGGILLCWKDNIDFRMITSKDSLISGLIFMPHTQTSWLFTRLYGPANPSMKPQFCNQLIEIEKIGTNRGL